MSNLVTNSIMAHPGECPPDYAGTHIKYIAAMECNYAEAECMSGKGGKPPNAHTSKVYGIFRSPGHSYIWDTEVLVGRDLNTHSTARLTPT